MRKVNLIQRTLPITHFNCPDPAKSLQPGQSEIHPTLAQPCDSHENWTADTTVIAIEPIGIAKEPEVRYLCREWQRGEDEIHRHAKCLAQKRFGQPLSKLSGGRYWHRMIYMRAYSRGGRVGRTLGHTLGEEGVKAACERCVSEKLPHLVVNLPLELCGGAARL
jgi:hypothetical protein